MSIQSEIDRINSNVQSTLNTIADTGVSVGTNSDALPAAALSLVNEKQDKLTGTAGQVVGFDASGNAAAQEAPADIFVVTVTQSDTSISADKTFAEITEAYEDGKTCICKNEYEGKEYHYYLGYYESAYGYIFVNNTGGNGSSALIIKPDDTVDENGSSFLQTTGGTVYGTLQISTLDGRQSPSISLLRNTKLVAAEETPTVNGEIFWTYG